MPDAPLSRRARRTFEEEAADRAASQDPTIAIANGLSRGESGAVDSEGTVISRRDRRRMERLAHPLEAWTAEEEMIATGQIPMMTPERIAEQERISREKAEAAAQEAAAASLEFRRVTESDLRRAQEHAAPVAPVVPVFAEPVIADPVIADPEPVAQFPVESAPAPEQSWDEPSWAEQSAPAEKPSWSEQAAPVEPSWEEQAAHPVPAWSEPALSEPALPEFPSADLDQASAPPVDDAPAHAVGLVFETYQPRMALDEAPLAHVVHPSHDEAPIAPEPHEALEPQEALEPIVERPNIFEALFPPGSSQAMLRQQDPFATAPQDAQAPAESGQIPTLLPAQEVPARVLSPVDEMRRLAAEAMSGIERAAKADEAAAAAAAAAAVANPVQDPAAVAEFDSLPSAASHPATSQPAPSWPTEADGGPLASPTGANRVLANPASSNQSVANPSFDSIMNVPQSPEQTPATPPGGLAPHQAEFDQLIRTRSGDIDLRGVAERSAPTASGQFPMPGQQGQPASGQFPMPGQQGQPASGQFPMPGQQGQPASGQFPMPGQQSAPQAWPPAPQTLAAPLGPAWTTQPQNPGPAAADPNDFTPLTNVPTPDFSGLYQASQPAGFPPVTGGINTSGFNTSGFNTADASASGQVPSIRRPDLPEVGGAKHFKWLHLAVIGALMFVLGVVIYNAAFAS